MEIKNTDIKIIKEINSYFKKSEKKDLLAYVRVFGCQQNEADADTIRKFLLILGFSFTENIEKAQFIIINTCAIRHTAENKVFGYIGELKKIKNKNENVFICVCGCMTEQKKMREKILNNYSFIDLVFGTNYESIVILIHEKILEYKKDNIVDCNNLSYENLNLENNILNRRKSKFKALIPIISGCNNFCSYCVVPFVRGREKSRDIDEILEEISFLIKNEYKEIILLGQNVNSYGNDDKTYNFAKLLYKIDKIKGNFRLRFISSHPKDFSKELIKVIKDMEHFCGHIHLPFQSGSNKILKLMNRGYTKEEYLDIIDNISFNSVFLVSSDVIIGFPGETEEDFNQTLDLVKKSSFVSLFTFLYSPRENTAALKLKNDVTHEQKIKRMNGINNLQKKITIKIFEEKIIKVQHRALIEEIRDNYFIARLDNNLCIHVDKNNTNVVNIGEFINVVPKSYKNGILFC